MGVQFDTKTVAWVRTYLRIVDLEVDVSRSPIAIHLVHTAVHVTYAQGRLPPVSVHN